MVSVCMNIGFDVQLDPCSLNLFCVLWEYVLRLAETDGRLSLQYSSNVLAY